MACEIFVKLTNYPIILQGLNENEFKYFMETIEKNFLQNNLKIEEIILARDLENWNKVIKFLYNSI